MNRKSIFDIRDEGTSMCGPCIDISVLRAGSMHRPYRGSGQRESKWQLLTDGCQEAG